MVFTLNLAGQYLNSNYGHLKPEGVAGQYFNSKYGHLTPESWQGSIWTVTMAILHLNVGRAVFGQQLWPS